MQNEEWNVSAVSLSPELVPPRALIREFIGDSAFYR